LLQPFDVVALGCLHLRPQVPVERRPRPHLSPRRLIRIAAAEELAAQLEISTRWWRRSEVARAVHDLFELEPSLFHHPKLGQDPPGDAVRFGEQAEQDVLCAQEGMPAIAGHLSRLAKRAAQPGRQREALDLVHLKRHDARAPAALASPALIGACAGAGTY